MKRIDVFVLVFDQIPCVERRESWNVEESGFVIEQ